MAKSVINKNKAGKELGCRSGITVLNKTVREGLFEKASFEERFKGGEGTNCVEI